MVVKQVQVTALGGIDGGWAGCLWLEAWSLFAAMSTVGKGKAPGPVA